jgi:hypothetical protein
MSTTRMAGAISLDGPLPRPPEYDITTVAYPIDAERWRGGANLIPVPPAMPDSVDPCNDGTFRLKETPEVVDLPGTFSSFRAYLGEICSAQFIGDWNAWTERANEAMRARSSWALERQLADASFQDEPSLSDATVFPGGVSALPFVTAVAYLEGFIATSGEAGVLHITPQVAAQMGFNYLRTDGEIAVTANGTRVIIGAGYSGAGHPTSGGAGAAAAGQSWIYATHDVLYAMSDDVIALPDSLSEALDREINEIVYRAERDMLVAFDDGFLAAALADWSP